jgi:D-alanyl-D-alanine carboxypeptidase
MKRARSLGGHLASAVAGVVIGALVVLGIDGMTRPLSKGPGGFRAPPPPPRLAEPLVTERPSGIVLAWAPGGIPVAAERAVERLPGVRRATTVAAGLDWIKSTRSVQGLRLTRAPKGMAIPFETAAVHPREYAHFVAPAERDEVLGLATGQMLLAETSAELRAGGAGTTLHLVDRRARVTGVVTDVATNGYEGIVAWPPPRSWERVDRFLLIHNRSARRAGIELAIRRHLEPGQRLRIRVSDEQPFLRYGDAVHPQMVLKDAFGEFAARPLPDGRLEIQPSWSQANIRSARVPVLGTVTCHRALFPQLRRALRSVQSAGLAHLIDPDSFGGCYGPRFINSDPDGRLSHHAWGVAFDINVADNPFGAEPNLSPRLVEAIEYWGFTWGGRWLLPDGMHFEWQAWP